MHNMEQDSPILSIAEVKLDIPNVIQTTTYTLTKMEKRAFYLEEIHGFYMRESDNRKKENWRRYCKWCKDNRLSDTKENQKKFKKQQQFIKEYSLSRLTYLLNFMPTDDLPYIVSTAREFAHSKKNFTAWLSTFIFSKK